ncbi:MAG: hypothetical protein LBE91_21340 [Tannerella sp.]|nr:hypothetical protein [Tannerella sp.]
MRKEIGKWMLDVAKYVATAFLISSFFGDITKKWAMYAVGSTTVIVLIIFGLWFIKDKKEV